MNGRLRSIGGAMVGLIAFLPIQGRVAAQAIDVVVDPEAHAVYAAVLKLRFTSNDKPLTAVALLQQTRAVLPPPCGLEEKIPQDPRSVFARLPGGMLVTLSAVGFNPEKTRAMVTVQTNCFPLLEPEAEKRPCHEGRQVLMEREGGRWVPAASSEICCWCLNSIVVWTYTFAIYFLLGSSAGFT